MNNRTDLQFGIAMLAACALLTWSSYKAGYNSGFESGEQKYAREFMQIIAKDPVGTGNTNTVYVPTDYYAEDSKNGVEGKEYK